MHGEDAAGDELSMLADAEMPRLYPHHVIEHELQVEPPFHAHLARAKGSGTRCQHMLPPCSPSPHPPGTHCTPGHPPRAWYKPNPRGCTTGGVLCKKGMLWGTPCHNHSRVLVGTAPCAGCCRYLGEHGLAVLGHHGALVAVQRDEVVVEGLLGVLEHVVELRGPPFKDAAEVTGNQSPADRWSGKRRKMKSVNPAPEGVLAHSSPRGTAASRSHGPAATHCISLVHPPSRK